MLRLIARPATGEVASGSGRSCGFALAETARGGPVLKAHENAPCRGGLLQTRRLSGHQRSGQGVRCHRPSAPVQHSRQRNRRGGERCRNVAEHQRRRWGNTCGPWREARRRRLLGMVWVGRPARISLATGCPGADQQTQLLRVGPEPLRPRAPTAPHIKLTTMIVPCKPD